MDALDLGVRTLLGAGPVLREPARVSVVARVVGGPDVISVDADGIFHAASAMKVPVLVELYRRVETGSLRLDDTLAVTTEFRSNVAANMLVELLGAAAISAAMVELGAASLRSSAGSRMGQRTPRA